MKLFHKMYSKQIEFEGISLHSCTISGWISQLTLNHFMHSSKLIRMRLYEQLTLGFQIWFQLWQVLHVLVWVIDVAWLILLYFNFLLYFIYFSLLLNLLRFFLLKFFVYFLLGNDLQFFLNFLFLHVNLLLILLHFILQFMLDVVCDLAQPLVVFSGAGVADLLYLGADIINNIIEPIRNLWFSQFKSKALLVRVQFY